MKKDLFDINLQLFADGEKEAGEDPSNNGGNELPEENKAYTEKELDKMLRKEKAKAKKS